MTAGGAPDGSASGAPNREAGAPAVGVGGLLDPVASAGAQEGGATGAGPGAAPLTYTEHTIECRSLIKLNGTNYPSATLKILPASLLTAARTIVVSPSSADGWLQAGTGGFVRPDGSEVGTMCAKATDTVTFFTPDN